MKQEEVFKKIGGIITEISEQYQYLKTSGELYNDLELELMVANAHFLSDHLEILRKVNAHAAPLPASVASKPAATTPPKTEPAPVEQEKPDEPVFERAPAENAGEHTIEFEIGNKAETIRHELNVEDIGEDWDETEEPEMKSEVKPVEQEAKPVNKTADTEPAQPKPQPQALPVTPPHTQILVPEDQVITLNERMSAQAAQPRMGDQLNAQPITDLKTAITLNDKLLYIKDLFNGYSLAYSEAIDILNRMHSFEEAESYLKSNYATKNHWADKSITADKFYALLQRRYV